MPIWHQQHTPRALLAGGLRARPRPVRAELGIAGRSMSPGLATMTDLAAAAGPFAKAADLLEHLAGGQPDRQARR